MKVAVARTLHRQPVRRGGKAMGDSWASSRLSTRIALRLRLKHGSIGALWPNMSGWRRRSGEVMSLAADLGHLRDALKLICPNTDWSWLLTIIKRIAATTPRRAGKYHLVTSDRLYLLGIELMDRAVADADVAQRTDKAHAFQYRDGLVIALLALIPLRSRTLTALRIGQHLVKTGDSMGARHTSRRHQDSAGPRFSGVPRNLGAHRFVSGAIPQPHPWC